jgi:hypothetical protein
MRLEKDRDSRVESRASYNLNILNRKAGTLIAFNAVSLGIRTKMHLKATLVPNAVKGFVLLPIHWLHEHQGQNPTLENCYLPKYKLLEVFSTKPRVNTCRR